MKFSGAGPSAAEPAVGGCGVLIVIGTFSSPAASNDLTKCVRGEKEFFHANKRDPTRVHQMGRSFECLLRGGIPEFAKGGAGNHGNLQRSCSLFCSAGSDRAPVGNSRSSGLRAS